MINTFTTDCLPIKKISPNFFKYIKISQEFSINLERTFQIYSSLFRQKLENSLLDQYDSQKGKTIFITGPSGGGKTISLLEIISYNTHLRRMYINLKTFEKISFTKRSELCYEITRITDDYDEYLIILNRINDHCRNENIFQIINEIIDYHIEKQLPLLLIIDQYKSIRINGPLHLLLDKIKESKITMVVCSSVSDDKVICHLLEIGINLSLGFLVGDMLFI